MTAPRRKFRTHKAEHHVTISEKAIDSQLHLSTMFSSHVRDTTAGQTHDAQPGISTYSGVRNRLHSKLSEKINTSR